MSSHPDPVRRERLLDSVAEYLLARGLADLSLRPLAAELGTSPRMLLYYFESKEELLSEALARVRLWEQEQAAAWIAADEELAPVDLLRRAWQWLTSKEAERFLRLFFEVYGLALQNPDRYAGFLEHVVADWIPFAESVIDTGGPGPARRQGATLLIASLRGLLLDLLATGDRRRVNGGFERLLENLLAQEVAR